MTEITSDHIRWATTARLGELLQTLPKSEFDVTLTFSIFTSILVGTLDQLRQKGSVYEPAWSVIKNQQAAASPWSVPLRRSTHSGVTGALTAAEFLTEARNSICHQADGWPDRVTPHHEVVRTGRPDRQLLGYSIKLGKSGLIATLKVAEMKRIGGEVVRRFCDAASDDFRTDAQHALAA